MEGARESERRRARESRGDDTTRCLCLCERVVRPKSRLARPRVFRPSRPPSTIASPGDAVDRSSFLETSTSRSFEGTNRRSDDVRERWTEVLDRYEC